MLRVIKSPLPLYRVSRWLYLHHIPILPSFLAYFARWMYACWLPPNAQLGGNCTLGYGGLGVVINGDSRIGDNVQIGHQVTLGGNATQEGAPTICDNVYIGTGAKILGPITIGAGSVVAANAVVTRNVPPRSVVGGVPARVLKSDIEIEDYLYHLRSRKNR